MYLGLAKTFDILHASTYSQQRVMNTFTEMITMGTIHTQQFQTMLGRDLPGEDFIHKTAQELHLTDAAFIELLKHGQLTATEVIPAVAAALNKAADHGSALQSAINGTNATLNRFHTAVFEMESDLSDKLTPSLEQVVNVLTNVIHILYPLQTQLTETSVNFHNISNATDELIAHTLPFGPTVKASFTPLQEAVLGAAEGFDFLKGVVIGVFDVLKSFVDTVVTLLVDGFFADVYVLKLVADAFLSLLTIVEQTGQGIAAVVVQIGTALKDLVTGHFEQAKQDAQAIGTVMGQAFNFKAIGSTLSEDLADIKDTGVNAAKSIGSTWMETGRSIKDVWQSTSAEIAKISTLQAKGAGPGAIPSVTGATPANLSGVGAGIMVGKHTTLEEGIDKALQSMNEFGKAQNQVATEGTNEFKLWQQQQLQVAGAIKSSALNEITTQQTAIEQKRALGQISATEEIASLAQLEQQRYAVIMEELVKEERLYADQPNKLTEINKQEEALQAAHGQKMAQLQGQYMNAETQKFMHFMDPVNQAFNSSIDGMIRGTQTLQGAMRNMLQSIVSEYIRMVLETVEHWIAGELAKTAATTAGTATRLGVQQTANSQSLISESLTVGKEILMRVWSTMAAVYSAIAGIPYVGPFLAPAMAIAAGATIGTYAAHVASAAGGYYEVPGDQMAMIHKQEMVLPAGPAQGLRELIENNGGGPGGGTHVHIHAVDGDSVKNLFMKHNDALAAAMRKAIRNGG
ncbi:MAG: hypothetical protein ACRD0E_06730, partial [Acidimicrobiales bacterium]